jgi:hypothetical protein
LQLADTALRSTPKGLGISNAGNVTQDGTLNITATVSALALNNGRLLSLGLVVIDGLQNVAVVGTNVVCVWAQIGPISSL